MRAIKGKDTTPEMAVRRALFSRGFRYRLHVKELPSKPDLVLPKFKTVIFVNGCFWHQHQGCKYSTTPTSNTAFWTKKLADTVSRDKRNHSQLHALGWNVILVWECELRAEGWEDRLISSIISSS